MSRYFSPLQKHTVIFFIAGMSSAKMALAQAPCQLPPNQTPPNAAVRAAHLACAEHQLWRQPFINRMGHINQIGPMEGERDELANGSPAWQRVLYYWQNSVGESVLFRHQSMPSHADESIQQAVIRRQIIDTPWSSAFISYLMKQSGFTAEQFNFDDGHIRYIKPAYVPLLQTSPIQPNYAYQTKNPYTTVLAAGDLLCHTREGAQVFGAKGFDQWLNEHHSDSTSLRMHCDIIVSTQSNTAYTIGGNVVQAVTMRALKLTTRGYLSPSMALPVHTPSTFNATKDNALTCNIATGTHCNMNKKDWVVLLQYRQPQSF